MPFIGIDLGTTFSAVAYLDPQGAPVTVPNSEGELTTPSVVLFDQSGDIIVGREARRAALAEPGRVAECVKRHMGEPFYPRLINGTRYTPTALSALILKKLKQDAERRIGVIDGAVITVPAYFDESRRQATAAAGELAGLKVLDIINEPTSAALAYVYRGLVSAKEAKPADADCPRIAVVCDLGGGTFDATVIRVVGRDITVLATAGDVRLGGRDWDERLASHLADRFLREFDSDPREDLLGLQQLMLVAEETKKMLSSRTVARYVINHAGRSLIGEISRENFQEMTGDLLFRAESRLVRVMKQAQVAWADVQEVLAVGGSTRMPQVVEMLRRVSGKEPNRSLSPDEVVAHGAAIHAAVCSVSPSPAAGLQVRKSPAPASSPAPDVTVRTPGVLDYFKARIIELLRSIRTTNVNAHSLGVVVTLGDGSSGVTVLIPHNTKLPISATKRFGTVRDNQAHVTVRVVEGESSVPDECIQVASCEVKPLPTGLPRNSPVDVTFTYDNSGRLHVEAVDVTSGNWATALLQRRSGVVQKKVQLASDEELMRVKVS